MPKDWQESWIHLYRQPCHVRAVALLPFARLITAVDINQEHWKKHISGMVIHLPQKPQGEQEPT